MLLVFTVVIGIGYPLRGHRHRPAARPQTPRRRLARHGRRQGRRLRSCSARRFTDSHGNPLPQYFQSRPSAAGDGYDPTATGASNLGPESIVDTLPDPAVKGDTGTQSLLTQVCARSLAVGKLDGVDGPRPFCTPDGVGAVLAVFWSGPGYHGHGRPGSSASTRRAPPSRSCHLPGRAGRVRDVRRGLRATGQVVPIRGDAPAHPAVPADAVTASPASGLDPEISPAYARLQGPAWPRARGHLRRRRSPRWSTKYTAGRDLGFMGEPRVNVLRLNLALDRDVPVPAA